MRPAKAGDNVLVSIARACEQIRRESDLLARYGGEEFVFLLPETDGTGALEVAEKLRQTVEALKVPCQTDQIQVTVSIGVADLSEIRPLSLDAAIRMADDCLYRAKGCCRNTICHSDQLN